jgi:hypothetical protein
MFDKLATDDFQRALNRASWRKIQGRLTGVDNRLLPYDEVRSRLPIRGQHYIGLHQVLIEKIVGSMGRYNDFDRAFLPTQNRTRDRWINIDKAHYSDIPLPPVELYKIGEIYFVKDGNHRVSVAHERGQLYIDAYVIEIDIPIKLTAETKMDDLVLKEKQAEFMVNTNLHTLHPSTELELTSPDLYDLLLEHIATHRWYLGVERKAEVSNDEAVISWYENVYLPLVEEIRQQELLKSFPGHTETDLYLWIMEYQKYLRQAYSAEESGEDLAKSVAAEQLVKNFPQSNVSKLIQLMSHTNWLDQLILNQERANFFEQTHILDLRPEAQIETTLPGKYDRLLDHIATHRWYLGEHRQAEVSFEQAVTSWYDNVYIPIVQVIREQEMLKDFPYRTETDLYLWIVRHQWHLRETYGEEVPIQKAAEEVTGQFGVSSPRSILQKVVDTIKGWFGANRLH